ncbi:MAG TPA: PIN domain nuclease [Acetobacteraceae bacterium]
MIVVDSSVWIGLLRGADSGPVHRLRGFAETEDDQILVGDLVLLEVLQGARDEAHASRIERNLRRYPVVPMLSDSLGVLAARNYWRLRGRGITVRKTVDMIIGTYCLEGGHILLHDDRDFDPMAQHLGLQVT